VFFDLGGTLFSYGALRGRFGGALEALARAHALDVPPEELRRRYQESVARVMAEYVGRPFYLHRDLFAEAQARMLSVFGKAPGAGPPARVAETEGLGLEGVRAREGTREVLERLRAAGLHLAVVSNIDDDQFEAIWSRIQLADCFDAVTTSEQARSCKPHPGIFELALRKAGVPAAAAAFVGDSLHHDVAGANAVGMRSVWLSRVPAPGGGAPAPDHVIGDLRELPDLLLS
jgi:2-haloalkanoic acid dehalogenase type II